MPEPRPVTQRQRRILLEVYRYLQEHGRSPTLSDLMTATGISSRSGVLVQLAALRRKGYVDWTERVARSIRLTGLRMVPTISQDMEGHRLLEELQLAGVTTEQPLGADVG